MPADRREPLGARVGLLAVLLNVFLWLGFRHVDYLVVSFAGTVLALAGLVLAKRAGIRIRKKQGRIAGDHIATLGTWGNAFFLSMNFLLFCYLLGIGILSGELL